MTLRYQPVTLDEFVVTNDCSLTGNLTFQQNPLSLWTNGLLYAFHLFLIIVVSAGTLAVVIVVIRTKRLHRPPHFLI